MKKKQQDGDSSVVEAPKDLSRRGFLKGFGAGGALVVAVGTVGACDKKSGPGPIVFEDVLVGTIEDGVSRDYSPITGLERTAVPSACWQCVARDGIVGYVEDGRLEHIEGNPRLLRTNGKLCSRGQAGVGQVYDPDRLLFPMKRVAGTARGDGQWERISWTDALDLLEEKLREPLAAGTPERFMFHYGRMKASSSTLVKDYFLPAYGTKSYAGHTAICEATKWTAQELVWGAHYEINDVMNSSVILNFGCNPLEAHTNHLPFTQRIVKAMADNGTPMYTFDVRLSNTAARSNEWIPIQPGTDLAVVLAMANHILSNGLAPAEGLAFINTWTDIDPATGPNAPYTDRVAKLTEILGDPGAYLTWVKANDVDVPALWADGDQPAGGYSPTWAAGISGVAASKIIELAELYAAGSPGSTIISYRGAVMHFNGCNCERAVQLLEGICGNIEVPGGRVHAVGASWTKGVTYPKPSNTVAGLHVMNDGAYVAPSHHADHQVLSEIKKAHDEGRPEDAPMVYMVYCYTPAYANGDIQGNINILKNETYLPFIVVSDVGYTEAAMYADLVLPDTNYLERWDFEDMVSMDFIKEYYIRQPVVSALGEAEDLKDTLIKLAARLVDVAPEMQKVADIGTMENFVQASCLDTAAVHDAGVAAGYADGFEFMKAEGAYYDPTATPSYESHLGTVTVSPVDPTTILDTDPDDYEFEDAEGIVWEGTKAEFNAGYRNTSSAYKHYLGQNIGGTYYRGFKPDKVNKSGRFEIESPIMAAKHWPAFPLWHPIPEHATLASDELILTTFKNANQTHSRTQNCKVLSEMSHDNPAWLNAATASSLGVSDGDTVRLTLAGPMFNDLTADPALAKSVTQTSMEVQVRVTEAIHPAVIAISHSAGHWAYGRYASGTTHVMADDPEQTAHAAADVDTSLQWWDKFGHRSNWVMPNAGDPVGGGLRYMDVVVQVQRV